MGRGSSQGITASTWEFSSMPPIRLSKTAHCPVLALLPVQAPGEAPWVLQTNPAPAGVRARLLLPSCPPPSRIHQQNKIKRGGRGHTAQLASVRVPHMRVSTSQVWALMPC